MSCLACCVCCMVTTMIFILAAVIFGTVLVTPKLGCESYFELQCCQWCHYISSAKYKVSEAEALELFKYENCPETGDKRKIDESEYIASTCASSWIWDVSTSCLDVCVTTTPPITTSSTTKAPKKKEGNESEEEENDEEDEEDKENERRRRRLFHKSQVKRLFRVRGPPREWKIRKPR